MSRRLWSKTEDEKLYSLVHHFGDQRGKEGRWDEISKRLPGRTNKDCRKRWFYSLNPDLRKGRWTKAEDELLLAAHQRLGPAWKEIALLIKGRRDDQCSKRFNEILNPCAQNRLKHWSPEEDQYLTAKVNELGNKWAVIAAGLPGRPPLTCRNRWRRISRELSKMTELSSNEPASSTNPSPAESTSTNPVSAPSHSTDLDIQTSEHATEVHLPDMRTELDDNIPYLSSPFNFTDIDNPPLQGLGQPYMPLPNYTSSHYPQPENSHGLSSMGPLDLLDADYESEVNSLFTDLFPPGPETPAQQDPSHNRYLSWTQTSGTGLQPHSTVDTSNTTLHEVNTLEPQIPASGIQQTPNRALEEEAVRQVLLSPSRWSASAPENAWSGSTAGAVIHHVHHFRHHHYHHYHHHHH